MIVVFDVTYEDFRASDPPLGCELQGDDLNGRLYKMVRINGLTSKWARKNNVTSGDNTISFPEGAYIIEATNQLLFPAESTIKVSPHRDRPVPLVSIVVVKPIAHRNPADWSHKEKRWWHHFTEPDKNVRSQRYVLES